LVGLLSACAAPGQVELHGAHGRAAILRLSDDAPPCLWPVWTIDGVQVTRSFPFRGDVTGEAHDHPHHRGVWFAHGDVNGVDFWHKGGTMTTDSVKRIDGGVRTTHCWLDAEGMPIARETRLTQVHDAHGVRRITISLSIEPRGGPLIFGDTKEGAMAIRLHPQLRVKGDVASGSLRTEQGKVDADAWGTRAAWCEASGSIDGRRVRVRLVDDVDNVNHPTWWHARTYGLLAANPFGRRAFEGKGVEPMRVEVPLGESLQLRWVVELRDGATGG
jgi:hypothetical protein